MTRVLRTMCSRKEFERALKEENLDDMLILPSESDGNNKNIDLLIKTKWKRSKHISRLNRRKREKGKNTASINDAFKQKWLNEQKNKEEK